MKKSNLIEKEAVAIWEKVKDQLPAEIKTDFIKKLKKTIDSQRKWNKTEDYYCSVQLKYKKTGMFDIFIDKAKTSYRFSYYFEMDGQKKFSIKM